MNFCKDCKHVDKRVFSWCAHPKSVYYDYIRGEKLTTLCINVRSLDPYCPRWEKKEPLIQILKRKLGV